MHIELLLKALTLLSQVQFCRTSCFFIFQFCFLSQNQSTSEQSLLKYEPRPKSHQSARTGTVFYHSPILHEFVHLTDKLDMVLNLLNPKIKRAALSLQFNAIHSFAATFKTFWFTFIVIQNTKSHFCLLCCSYDLSFKGIV